MGLKDSYNILRTHLMIFLEDWFGLASVEENSSIIVALLTVTHVSSFLMVICQPIFTSCFDYFGALSLIEMIAIFMWSMTLLALYLCHRFHSIHRQRIVKFVYYLHFAGIIWLPMLVTQWSFCIKAVSIPSIFSDGTFVLNYAPLSLNGCLTSISNCYRSYSFSHVEILMMSSTIGVSYSLYILIMRKMEEYTISQYFDKIMSGRTTDSARNRIRSYSMSIISLSDSLCRLCPYSTSERQRPATSSSSDEQIPLGMAASNSPEVEPDRVTVVRRGNNATVQGQQFEFEVHPRPFESLV